MTWSVAGTYFEACSCLPVCPCRQVGGRDGTRSTLGICEFALSWAIVDGRLDDLDLRGRRVVMVGAYDDDERGSPWTVRLFVDDEASRAQAGVLEDIFLGRVGGTPSRNYTPAIATVASVDRARITLDHRRRRWSIRVDEIIDVAAVDEVLSDEPVACGIPGLDQPGQEVVSTVLRVAAPPLTWEWNDRCGFATRFDYRSD